jgi:ribosome assembly protein 1
LDRTKAAEASLRALGIGENCVAEGGLGHDFDHHVETGFQLATFQGPLCYEPVEGMAYFLESLEVVSDETKPDTEGVSFLFSLPLRNVD